MSEKVKLTSDVIESNLGWAILALVSESKTDKMAEVFPELKNPNRADEPLEAEIELKINGVTLSFSKLLDRMLENHEWETKCAARELINRRVAGLEAEFASFDEDRRIASWRLLDALEKRLGISLRED